MNVDMHTQKITTEQVVQYSHLLSVSVRRPYYWKYKVAIWVSAGCLLLSFPVLAAEVTFSGFMSIVGGKVLSGSRSTPYNDVQCPCYIADWGNLATYNQNVSFNQESRAGFRMNAQINDELSGVIQVDGRTLNGGKGTLEWAYVTYKPAEDWEAHVGRKRLPIYYYSDFMDVGFAYPWVRPPPDLYGWEVDNFNGVTLVKSGRWGDWNSRASLFYGREDSKANIFSSVYYPGQFPDLTWRDIVGADLELTHDWFNMRMVYIESKVDLTGNAGPIVAGGQQRIYGLSMNVDYENWLLRSEFSLFDRWRDIGYRSNAWMVGVGKHYDNLTPMLTYSEFSDEKSYDEAVSMDSNIIISLRYDVDTRSAIKFQYDIARELSSPNSTAGDAKIISVAYDKIF
jgi:hypothetical protein